MSDEPDIKVCVDDTWLVRRLSDPLGPGHVSVGVTCPIPPSTNNLYASGAKRFLRPAGRKLKDQIIAAIVRELDFVSFEGGWEGFVQAMHRGGGSSDVELLLHHPDIYNKSWKRGSLTRTKNGYRSPYKQMDTLNYVKLVEDAVKDATGIDDSFSVDGVFGKRYAKQPSVQLSVTYTLWGKDDGP